EKGLLRFLRRRAATAQQQGQRPHQHRPDHQGQRGGGAVGKELGGRIIGGGVLPQPQQESHRPAGQGQDGQENVFSHGSKTSSGKTGPRAAQQAFIIMRAEQSRKPKRSRRPALFK